MTRSGQAVRRPRPALLVLLTAILAIALSACGSSAPGPSAPSPPSKLIESSEIAKYPAGSVERTFLELWSSLQFQSWADITAFYDPGLRDAIGTATLVGAKKVGATVYPYLKPEIVRTSKSQGVKTIFYSLVREDGTKELASISWRKVDGNWQIVYDSRMDAELSQQAQEKVTLAAGGLGSGEATAPLSAEAIKAGKAAAQAQARYLEQELLSAP